MSREHPAPDRDVVETGRSTSGNWKRAISAVLLAIGGIGGYVVGDISADPDVSDDGQVSYACALAADIRQDHRSEEDWGDLGADRAYNELFALRPLLEGAVQQRSEEGGRFAALDWGLLSDGTAELGELLDRVVDACENR